MSTDVKIHFDTTNVEEFEWDLDAYIFDASRDQLQDLIMNACHFLECLQARQARQVSPCPELTQQQKFTYTNNATSAVRRASQRLYRMLMSNPTAS